MCIFLQHNYSESWFLRLFAKSSHLFFRHSYRGGSSQVALDLPRAPCGPTSEIARLSAVRGSSAKHFSSVSIPPTQLPWRTFQVALDLPRAPCGLNSEVPAGSRGKVGGPVGLDRIWVHGLGLFSLVAAKRQFR